MVPTAAPAAPEVEVANPSAVDGAACVPSPPSGPGRRFGSSSSLPLPVRSIASIVVAEVLTPIDSLESGESDAGRRTEYDAVTQSQAVVYGRVRVRVCVWGYLGLLSGDVRSKGEQGKQNQRSCSSIGCEFDALQLRLSHVLHTPAGITLNSPVCFRTCPPPFSTPRMHSVQRKPRQSPMGPMGT